MPVLELGAALLPAAALLVVVAVLGVPPAAFVPALPRLPLVAAAFAPALPTLLFADIAGAVAVDVSPIEPGPGLAPEPELEHAVTNVAHSVLPITPSRRSSSLSDLFMAFTSRQAGSIAR